MSQHRNKLNREKQGRDRLFSVTIKISAQCKEVLSRHNKLGHDITIKLNTKESYRDRKIGSRQKIFTTPRSHVAIS